MTAEEIRNLSKEYFNKIGALLEKKDPQDLLVIAIASVPFAISFLSELTAQMAELNELSREVDSAVFGSPQTKKEGIKSNAS